MSGECQREMSLREWVERLPEIHRARKEYAALIAKEENGSSHNSVSPKLHRAVCRHCTGDQFRCESCVFGSEFNPSCATSGE
jgi:hypothetical protein